MRLDMKSPDANQSVREATEHLKRRLRPAAVLLYGSRATDTVNAGSDFDLAVLLDRAEPPFEEIAAARAELEDILRCPVDLVVLDRASPILAMEILRNHRVLALPDPEGLERFVVRALTDYFDLKIVRRPIEEALMRAGEK